MKRSRSMAVGRTVLEIWRLPPVAAALFLFLAGFCAIMVIRLTLEHHVYLTRWWAFRLGDSICLPLFIGAASYALRDYTPRGRFYDRVGWDITLLVTGIAFIVILEAQAVASGFRPMHRELEPSQIYHTCIFGIAFTWVGSAVLPLLSLGASRARAIALTALASFVVLYLIDVSPLQDHSRDVQGLGSSNRAADYPAGRSASSPYTRLITSRMTASSHDLRSL